jgi:AbrB family looped-hinge helix DNA binding protein
MALAKSRLTAQGQISVPAEVRRWLGVGPGSVLEWDEEDERIVVRRVGRYTSEDMHRALFPTPPSRRRLPELKENNTLNKSGVAEEDEPIGSLKRRLGRMRRVAK